MAADEEPLRGRCPTGHRNVDPDGHRMEKDHSGRQCWFLFTCRDCGVRLEQPYELRKRGPIRPIPFDRQRESA